MKLLKKYGPMIATALGAASAGVLLTLSVAKRDSSTGEKLLFKKVGAISSPISSLDIWRYQDDGQDCVIAINVITKGEGPRLATSSFASLDCKE